MSKVERRILRFLVKAIIRVNRNAWSELKWQIYDGGFQSYYPAQDDFASAAEHSISRLTSETRDELRIAWKSDVPSRPSLDEEHFEAIYARLVVEEIVERARVAAYRTIHW